jgi:exodeoxyribonuclease VII large subunit
MSEISREILSVGDLNRAIASSLEERFDTVWVSGEISNFKA